MAVTDFVTVQHVPFPVRTQRRTLEPDGIAIFNRSTAGTASGGNVLVTVRSDINEFFYIIKAVSYHVTATATPAEMDFVFNPAWIQDLDTGSTVFQLHSVAPARAFNGTFMIQNPHASDILKIGETVPLGRVRKLDEETPQNLVLFNFQDNVNAGVYVITGIFYVYRKEALTVPGFLDQLVRPAGGRGVEPR